MSKPTLSDEKRAEHVVRDWQRAVDFNVRLYEADSTEQNMRALDNSRLELSAAKIEWQRIKRARNPLLDKAAERILEPAL